jgi:hypothetical protein
MSNGLEKLGGKIGVLVSFKKIFDHFLVTLWIRLVHGGVNLGPQMFDVTFLEGECMKTNLMATWKGNGEIPIVVVDWVGGWKDLLGELCVVALSCLNKDT